MVDWNLDEKSLGKWQYLQHYKSIIPQKFLQGMTNIVGLTSSVSDTTPQFTSVLCKTIRIGDTKYHV